MYIHPGGWKNQQSIFNANQALKSAQPKFQMKSERWVAAFSGVGAQKIKFQCRRREDASQATTGQPTAMCENF